MIIPRQKIKVFMSSICGEEKYDNLRAKLKKLIEGTFAQYCEGGFYE